MTSPTGSPNSLHTAWLFASDNPWGIPSLQPVPLRDVPRSLAPYRSRIVARPGELARIGIHFFLDDHRFETVWSRPLKSLTALHPHQMVLTPDFSLYHDWPRTVQLWNTYRNRWCGAFWQAHGLTVIPTVSWARPDSYDFCFLGVPLHSVVAVGTVGVRLERPSVYQLFIDGFGEMVQRLRPSRVLCYGKLPAACREMVETREYTTRWQGIRRERVKVVRGAGYGG